MSASKDQRRERELERQCQQEEQAQAERRSMKLYTLVGAVCAVAVAVVLVLNSGLLQRSLAAVTVNGTDYSAADLQYYYNMEYENTARIAENYAMYGMDYGFDAGKSPADQVYDQETGESWEEHFVSNAKNSVTYLTAMYDAAVEAGHTLSQEAQDSMDKVLKSLDTAWLGSYNSRDAFIRARYGSYMTYDRLVELLERELLASDYVNSTAAGMEYTAEEREAYYTEHADELDTFYYTQFVLRAAEPTAEEGQEELTAEEKKAGLEQAKAEMKAVAEEIQDKLNSGADAADLAEEYEDVVYTAYVDDRRVGANVATTTYAQWMVDPARKQGDVNLSEYDGTTFYNYYVVQYGSRELDETKTADVRHMLIAAQQDEGAAQPTQEQYDEAKAKAQEILDQWKAGEATEESFAALVAENTADSSSAQNGGLMTGVSTTSGYIPEFTDWALDPARKSGDTGLVQNTGSTVKGWHVMYYVADGMPVWEQTADNALRTAEYTAWEEETLKGYEAVDGTGMLWM